ncbi:MAG: ABC transporter ATP-binding protein [Acidobacteriota bacterium]|nr:ABC transporter ATP-binding protein [Acidobacteriota bacterium]
MAASDRRGRKGFDSWSARKTRPVVEVGHGYIQSVTNQAAEAVSAPEVGETTSGRRAIVQIQGVSKLFDDSVAVNNLSLDIYEGEFFSLLGPSGCGKTTTLRMLGGFEEPTSGRILLGGKDVTYLAPYHRDVNTVFQSYALFPHLNIFENVAFGLRRRHVDKSEVARRVGEILEIVDLPGFEKRRASQLSGGQQQRVALARALINEPTLLLLDEPMSALDAKLRHQMQIELKRIQTQVGITFLYVTHDQEEAMTMSDRLAVMRHGVIEGIGSPKDIYDSPTTEFVATFLGASNLLEGQVTESNDVTTAVRIAGGATITLPTERMPKGLSGASVKVGVRPEKISLISSGADIGKRNSLRGRVLVSTFTGVGNQYIIELPDDTRITVYAQNIGDDTAPRSGEEAILAWPVEHTFAVVPMAGASVEAESES